MFLSAEGFPQTHRILGIVNATGRSAMSTEAIDSFEPMDQSFSDVQEKLRRWASEKSTDGAVGVRFTTDVADMQITPKFLVLTTYEAMIQFVE